MYVHLIDMECSKCNKSDEVVTRNDGSQYCLDCGMSITPKQPPIVGSCRPVFETDEECRKFFDDFRESVREDIKMFENARRSGWWRY